MIKNFSLYLAILSFGLVFAQQKTVSGVITDGEGVPLPGATIVVLETGAGASSDFDGNYSIQVEEGQTLAFSFVGYSTQELGVGMNSNLNIILQLGNALDEVVVTSLGIKRQKRELTYATQNVDTDGIDESRPNGNLVNSLQGQKNTLQIYME